MLRQAPFNAPFEPALLVFDLMKSTPLVDSGGPTTVMVYLSQEQVGTVPHIRTGPLPDQAVHDSPAFTWND